jgi:hypothetical protein
LVNCQQLLFNGTEFKLWLQFMQKPCRKHRLAFTKNTLLSVLYNFRILSLVGFYSNFGRFSRSNRGTVKPFDARTRCRPRAPRPCVSRPCHASRGHAPFPGSCAPRRLEVPVPRAGSPFVLDRTRYAPSEPRVRQRPPPLGARRPRPPPYQGRSFVTLLSQTSGRPYLNAARPSRVRQSSAATAIDCRPASLPLHPHPVSFGHPKLFPRTRGSLCRRPLPCVAPPSPESQPAAAATAGHRSAPSPEPLPRRPTSPIASR